MGGTPTRASAGFHPWKWMTLAAGMSTDRSASGYLTTYFSTPYGPIPASAWTQMGRRVRVTGTMSPSRSSMRTVTYALS